MGGLGQICLTLSYRYAPASVVAMFEYASIIFAILIGYFIFSEVVSSQMLIGVSIVICAGIIII
jgi:drug/metabolite transporter (DMT)-like permease